MPRPEPSLRQQLLDARSNVQRQIDRLEARQYPIAPIGFVRGGVITLILFLFGMMTWPCVAPFRANGVLLDNSDLIARLTRTLIDIEDALEGLALDEA
jgi:hypothetical protein